MLTEINSNMDCGISTIDNAIKRDIKVVGILRGVTLKENDHELLIFHEQANQVLVMKVHTQIVVTQCWQLYILLSSIFTWRPTPKS